MKENPLSQACPRCGFTAWERLPRNNFLYSHVLPLFKLYPWRCALCNKTRLLSVRKDAEMYLRGTKRSV